MWIGNLQYHITIEGDRKGFKLDMVISHNDSACVAPAAPVQQGKAQTAPDNGMDGIPVFYMEEIAALTEDSLFMVPLHSQPLFEMYPADPLYQLFMQGLIRNARYHYATTHTTDVCIGPAMSGKKRGGTRRSTGNQFVTNG